MNPDIVAQRARDEIEFGRKRGVVRKNDTENSVSKPQTSPVAALSNVFDRAPRVLTRYILRALKMKKAVPCAHIMQLARRMGFYQLSRGSKIFDTLPPEKFEYPHKFDEMDEITSRACGIFNVTLGLPLSL